MYQPRNTPTSTKRRRKNARQVNDQPSDFKDVTFSGGRISPAIKIKTCILFSENQYYSKITDAGGVTVLPI
jgi:hypothetical protein